MRLIFVGSYAINKVFSKIYFYVYYTVLYKTTSLVILTEVKVIDESGNVVPVGTPGELCTRAYSSMLCYWNDEEKTNELISKDRWLHSG